MIAKSPAKQDTRLILIEAGLQAMYERGYTNTGIQEVLSSVGVPKGSFYHYFESKEDFALQIIEHFNTNRSSLIVSALADRSQKPSERMRTYCQAHRDAILANKCRRGCLIGNLSQEMADQSEVLREALSRVMARWRDLFAECISEGQNSGDIKSGCESTRLAELFLSGWEGAIMRAKTTKSVEPIDAFIDLMFDFVLKP